MCCTNTHNRHEDMKTRRIKTGVLEYWDVRFMLHYSITPLLHYFHYFFVSLCLRGKHKEGKNEKTMYVVSAHRCCSEQ